MRRRELLANAVAAAVLAPSGAAAQPGRPTVGFLASATAEIWAPYAAAFRKGLAESGFEDGRNVALEYRWANGDYDRLPALAADLVDRRVSVIAAATTPAAVAAKAATASIPVVFMIIADPVGIGLVKSLSRPGGNVTGVTYLSAEIGPKLLELLHEAVPAATAIALLVNPANPSVRRQSDEVRAAAQTLDLQLHVLDARTPAEIDAAFARLARLRVGGLLIGGDPFFNSSRARIAGMALQLKLASIFQAPVYPEAGGLMSYGGDSLGAYRQAGIYAGRIVKGEKPADLPVQQATNFKLVINMKTAKALGLTVPQSLLARADEVIE